MRQPKHVIELFENIAQQILLVEASFVTWPNGQTFLDKQNANVWQTMLDRLLGPYSL